MVDEDGSLLYSRGQSHFKASNKHFLDLSTLSFKGLCNMCVYFSDCENCHSWSLCIHLMTFLLLIVKTCEYVLQVKWTAIRMLLFFSLAQFLIF